MIKKMIRQSSIYRYSEMTKGRIPFPIHALGSLSLSSSASWIPVEAPLGTAALNMPVAVETKHSKQTDIIVTVNQSVFAFFYFLFDVKIYFYI